MAANAVEVEWKKVMKFLSAMVAALLALPGSVMAQAQKMSNEWLTLSPANPRASIERNDRAAVTTSAEDGSTTVSIERRFHNRADSVASMSTLAASKKDRSLRLVVSLVLVRHDAGGHGGGAWDEGSRNRSAPHIGSLDRRRRAASHLSTHPPTG